ncbi:MULTISPECIES: hypothetical protein [Streptomyces]|uniref:Lipoprotein n=1 Tax=Streptomyces griseus subsp. griseus (strain JCM 4626 / CBS 651.72 / NBRC 13350 / KCC S-0626 / ISP 5235) TaxID=455632 RepID=B1VKU2_STRGG|nr:hypothetical protein [Streptomyces griseus]MBW3705614.1 hypothetical protein [Streptomyces griseus]NEB52154.1 hypothetical protein [Streptomyces griseus]BAG19970.1 hypothetical protein SGR_3141 [Streptomyces griseus subsp. griseus NBRC 13350]SEE85113.1 hypothetical protein SAMN04490359_6384 [Streptomyces griseus]
MRRIARTVRLTSSVAVAGVLLAGCGLLGSGKNGEVSDMDMQRAAERADQILYATVGEIKPEIEWVHRATTAGSCDVTRYWTVMTVISEQRRGNFLGVVERFWKANDYRIEMVNPSQDVPTIIATSPEGFGTRVKFGYKGQAFFEVTSPCVEKSKVAGPKRVANGRAYEGEIPTPNVRSAFWSAETPVPDPAPSP